jgi:hypothetical protein
MDVGVEYTQDPDRLAYARSKLFLAVADLADSSENLQERLGHAYATNLLPLGPSRFPDDLRPAYESIHARMTRIPAIAEGEGSLSPTIAFMPESDAKRLIADIVSLFGDVCEALGRRGN